jgi:hypothetical protein
MMVKFIASGCCAMAIALGSAPAFAAKGVLYDREKILREFFPGADAIEVENVAVAGDLAGRLQARLGYVPSREYAVQVGKKDGRVLGYAVIDDEKGMHEPITFAVLVGPDGAVLRQEVMVYRECEGDGVTARRFTRQFVGKTEKDPIRDGVDVEIVTGATISSHSMAVGVKRAVAVVNEGILARQRPLGRLPGAGY